MSDVLAVVTAGRASKGQDLAPLQGHPVIGYAIAAARQAKSVTRTVCATDDADIAQTAKGYGAEVPSLCSTPAFEPLLKWLCEQDDCRPEILVHLRSTCPIRFAGQIDEAVALLQTNLQATAVRSVCLAPCNAQGMWRVERQDSPFMRNLLDDVDEPNKQLWWQTGVIDVVRTQAALDRSMSVSRVLPLKTDGRFAVNIDDDLSLRVADALMQGLDCIRPAPLHDWSRVRLLALDVDGTLTPGTMYYGPDGEAMKRFHTHDGHGIVRLIEAGVQVAFITTESTAFAPARAAKLGIKEIHIGVRDKVSVVQDICARLGIAVSEVAYIGDDEGDVGALEAVAKAGGIACAVADARSGARSVASFHCPSRGGYGAVRDVCDLILAGKKPGETR